MDAKPQALPLFVLPSLDSTYGSFLIGVFVGLIFYGLSLHQGYVYMRTYVRDPLYFKLYVVLLLLMDTMHSVNVMIICYEGLVSNYFRPEQLLKSSWGFNVLPVVTGVVIILCQGFFAYRIYKGKLILGKRRLGGINLVYENYVVVRSS